MVLSINDSSDIHCCDPEKLDEAIIWADVETSGTNPETDVLLEVGMVITDMSGKTISGFWEILFEIRNLSKVIQTADAHVQKIHEHSGLWMDLWSKETMNYHEADQLLFEKICRTIPETTSLYFGGNSINLDRNFMRIYLPKTYSKISYRSVDVTSLSIALQSNTNIPGFEKGKEHRALKDALDSLEEYRHYLKWLKWDRE